MGLRLASVFSLMFIHIEADFQWLLKISVLIFVLDSITCKCSCEQYHIIFIFLSVQCSESNCVWTWWGDPVASTVLSWHKPSHHINYGWSPMWPTVDCRTPSPYCHFTIYTDIGMATWCASSIWTIGIQRCRVLTAFAVHLLQRHASCNNKQIKWLVKLVGQCFGSVSACNKFST